MLQMVVILLLLILSFGFSQEIIHTETDENGSLQSITYFKKTQNRIEKVKYETYYSNGQKWYERTYKDGEKDGLWTRWWENGQKEIEWTWKDGKKEGLFIKWYENGQKNSEYTFKDGKLISSKNWFSDGSVWE